MSIMGMKIRNYYFTWFVRYYLVYIFMHFICSLIITNQLPHIPFYLPFIVFILFDLVLIIQNFFIQVFLTRAKIGVVISLLFFVLQYVLSFISANSNNPSLAVNSSISVIPHAAFILAFQTMLYA
jgi:ATP-binding cassette subfamily A (ABC1) protein 3